MLITFCGVRGSVPAPGARFARYGGNTSCVAVSHSASAPPVLLLDAGTGLGNVTGLLGGRPFAGTMLLTHLHWDHSLGLPFFQAGDRDDARTSLLMPDQGLGVGAEELLARVMSPPFFPITPAGLRGDWRFGMISPGQFKAEGFTIEAREIPHKGGRTFGYRVSDERCALAYVTDHCPTARGQGPDGLGSYHSGAMALAESADLLIHDAQLLAEELASEAAFGHAAAEYAVRLAVRAGAGGWRCFTTSRRAPTPSWTRWPAGSPPPTSRSSWRPRACRSSCDAAGHDSAPESAAHEGVPGRYEGRLTAKGATWLQPDGIP